MMRLWIFGRLLGWMQKSATALETALNILWSLPWSSRLTPSAAFGGWWTHSP